MDTKEISVVGILGQTYQVTKTRDKEPSVNLVVVPGESVVQPITEDNSGIIAPSVAFEPCEASFT